jgi:hypothetical protein
MERTVTESSHVGVETGVGVGVAAPSTTSPVTVAPSCVSNDNDINDEESTFDFDQFPSVFFVQDGTTRGQSSHHPESSSSNHRNRSWQAVAPTSRTSHESHELDYVALSSIPLLPDSVSTWSPSLDSTRPPLSGRVSRPPCGGPPKQIQQWLHRRGASIHHHTNTTYHVATTSTATAPVTTTATRTMDQDVEDGRWLDQLIPWSPFDAPFSSCPQPQPLLLPPLILAPIPESPIVVGFSTPPPPPPPPSWTAVFESPPNSSSNPPPPLRRLRPCPLPNVHYTSQYQAIYYHEQVVSSSSVAAATTTTASSGEPSTFVVSEHSYLTNEEWTRQRQQREQHRRRRHHDIQHQQLQQHNETPWIYRTRSSGDNHYDDGEEEEERRQQQQQLLLQSSATRYCHWIPSFVRRTQPLQPRRRRRRRRRRDPSLSQRSPPSPQHQDLQDDEWREEEGLWPVPPVMESVGTSQSIMGVEMSYVTAAADNGNGSGRRMGRFLVRRPPRTDHPSVDNMFHPRRRLTHTTSTGFWSTGTAMISSSSSSSSDGSDVETPGVGSGEEEGTRRVLSLQDFTVNGSHPHERGHGTDSEDDEHDDNDDEVQWTEFIPYHHSERGPLI